MSTRMLGSALTRPLKKVFRREGIHELPSVTREQLGSPAIYFLAPDTDVPSAGCRIIYRHVDLLRTAGVLAFALHRKPDFRYSWFANTTPIK